MTIKENIIKELKNRLRRNEFCKKKIISYLNRSDIQAKDLLARIENGEFDEILSSVSIVRLDYLSNYDLARDNSTPPDIKEFRMYVLLKKK